MTKPVHVRRSVAPQVTVALSLMLSVAACGCTTARDAVGGDDTSAEDPGPSQPSTPADDGIWFDDGPCVDPLVEEVAWEQVPSILDLVRLEDPTAMDAVWAANGVDAGVRVEHAWDTGRSVRVTTFPNLDTADAAQCEAFWLVPAQVTLADQAGVIGPVSFPVEVQTTSAAWAWTAALDEATSSAFFIGPVPGGIPSSLDALSVGVSGGDRLTVEARPRIGTPGSDASEMSILHPAR